LLWDTTLLPSVKIRSAPTRVDKLKLVNWAFVILIIVLYLLYQTILPQIDFYGIFVVLGAIWFLVLIIFEEHPKKRERF